jgi:hypothetical protein
MAGEKRKFGDRWDGIWLRDIDPMHGIIPYVMPHRADRETFLKITVDLTKALQFLQKKNEGRTEDKYTLFHLIATSIVKTLTLRPKMNRFYQGGRLYQRRWLTLAFIVKKKFQDESHEALAFKYFGPDTTIDSLHEDLMKEIHQCRREDQNDTTTDFMEKFLRLPRWILRPVFFIIRRLDFFGKVPRDLITTDPSFASVLISNLGSIGLDAAYHHLNNWGTTSVFAAIGKMYDKTELNPDGSHFTHTVLDLGITLDEGIADGYYFSKTLKLLKHLIENPELLDLKASEEVEY